MKHLPINQIIQGDCLEIMKDFPDNSVDLILTDPPYGKKASKGTSGFGSAKNRKYDDDWDNFVPPQEYFDEILRIGKNAIIFGGNYFAHYLPPSNCWLVWDKKGDIAFDNPFADCELIYTTFPKVVKKYVFRQQGFIKDGKDEVVHPTQKPSELISKIISDWSGEADSILDPFLGSGTTAVAAQQLNRRFIGIEIEKKYCEIARDRLRQKTLL